MAAPTPQKQPQQQAPPRQAAAPQTAQRAGHGATWLFAILFVLVLIALIFVVIMLVQQEPTVSIGETGLTENQVEELIEDEVSDIEEEEEAVEVVEVSMLPYAVNTSHSYVGGSPSAEDLTYLKADGQTEIYQNALCVYPQNIYDNSDTEEVVSGSLLGLAAVKTEVDRIVGAENSEAFMAAYSGAIEAPGFAHDSVCNISNDIFVTAFDDPDALRVFKYDEERTYLAQTNLIGGVTDRIAGTYQLNGAIAIETAYADAGYGFWNIYLAGEDDKMDLVESCVDRPVDPLNLETLERIIECSREYLEPAA
jgi:hypothetical protein